MCVFVVLTIDKEVKVVIALRPKHISNDGCILKQLRDGSILRNT